MFKKHLVVIFILVWIVLAINPVHRGIWMLENLLVLCLFPVVLWMNKRYQLSNGTFLSLTLFAILHLFGANLTYEKMAYFTWFSEWFGWQRNYYDQLIHFLFGLLVFMTFFEVFYHQDHSRKASYLFAFLFISSIAAWYEILEWLAMVLFCTAPDCLLQVTQGDEWDTQKDMLYAVLGAGFTMLLHSEWHRHRSVRLSGKQS